MRFRGTLFEPGVRATRVERQFDVEWSESGLADAFRIEACHDKFRQQLWSPASYREGASRGNLGIEWIYEASLDKDCADVGEMDAVADRLTDLGYAYIVYSSWGHRDPHKTPNDMPEMFGPGGRGWDCFRVVLPFSRPVAPGEYRSIVPGLLGHELPADPERYRNEVLGRFVTMQSGRLRAAKPRGWDPCSSRPSQGYFAPTIREGVREPVVEIRAGRPVDVDAILARPTTAPVSWRAPRPYVAPDASAVGLLGRFSAALERAGVGGLSAPNLDGWCRTVCPSCQDPSPSLTARASGDGLEMRCHASCRRQDILAAIDFDPTEIPAPTHLRLALEEQLDRQPPLSVSLSVDAASERLEADLREALTDRAPTIIQYPPGTGKSFSTAKVMAEFAAKGERLVYLTQEHRVADETRRLLPPDVISVHIHSPLISVGGSPVCERLGELHSKVFDFGVSLLGEVCPKCPLRETCQALGEAKKRRERLAYAQVIFASHAGSAQIVGYDPDGFPKNPDVRLIVDEMPAAYARTEVSYEELTELASNARLYAAEATIAKAVAEVASAILERREPGTIRWGTKGAVIGNASDILIQEGRLRVRERGEPRPEEAARLRAADALIRIWKSHSDGFPVTGFDSPERGVWAMAPDPCHRALVERGGVLLSATPMHAALPGFRVRTVEVTDGAPVKRVMVLKAHRGHGALKEAYYDDAAGVRIRRAPLPGEAPGIPWPAVDAALERARREALLYGPGTRVLFVSFKAVIDALRARGVPDDVRLGHYGALRGKNDWMEGRPDECQVVYLFGEPRFAMWDTITALGKVGEEADHAWIEFAAGELTQAEGRLRLPRRTKPCTVFVEGGIAPVSWHTDNLSEIDESPDPETLSGLFEGLLRTMTLAEVAEILDEPDAMRWTARGVPFDFDIERLREAGRPTLAEGIRRLARMSPDRQEIFWDGFSWTDDVLVLG